MYIYIHIYCLLNAYCYGVDHTIPEDFMSCYAVRQFEEKRGPVDPGGLLLPPATDDAWIHAVKTRRLAIPARGSIARPI